MSLSLLKRARQASLDQEVEHFALVIDRPCQWRSKKGPPWRCKKGPLGGCGLVP